MNNNKDLADSLKAAKERLKALEKQTATNKNPSLFRKEVVIPVLLIMGLVIGLIVYYYSFSGKKQVTKGR